VNINEPQDKNFMLVAKAIEYIHANFTLQPSLEMIAEQVHLSPFHFQRLFTEWAGVSPKKFLQYISVNYAKELLNTQKASVLSAAQDTGLSGAGRLHDLFITIEGMTPGDYKNGGENLTVCFEFAKTHFGDLLIASTDKGICHLAFYEDQQNALDELQGQFPNAIYKKSSNEIQMKGLTFFQDHHLNKLDDIKLHLKGTPFQLKVWEALLKIPSGKITTYGDVCQHIGKPKAARAVGTAIGSNPIAFLIPCHRVIQATGAFGGYRWNPIRKTAMIGWEMAQHDKNNR
jgi:AraC family transcriptional regulator, regulatory protein of adaptative response / methylated-DNA-[protein]-cysteine methyltransferase